MARSQTYAPPAPRSPLLSDIVTMLPFPRKAYSVLDDSSAPLSPSSDPDTSNLLPTKGRTHHVWVQGRLAPVKNVSVVDLNRSGAKSSTLLVPTATSTSSASSRGTSPARSRYTDMTTPNRRWSFDDADAGDLHSDASEQRKQISRKNCQPRGYGIGGAGNIRRPTDVIHGPTRKSSMIDTLRSNSPDNVSTESKRHGLRQLLGLGIDRKGK